MSDKKKIRFIVNPFSGISKKDMFVKLLEKRMDPLLFDYDMHRTHGAGDAQSLTLDAISSGFDAVIAVGGDGSINEIGSALIGSPVCLGILPAGSGNGVARSLGIEMNVQKAMARIIRFEPSCIDTGEIADRKFIGIAGIGFDAHIGNRFLKKKFRGKLSYGALIMKEWPRFKPFPIIIPSLNLQKEAFILAFANTTQYGNNAVIAPFAEFQDGQLELVCVSAVTPLDIPELTWRVFSGKIHGSRHVLTQGFTELQVKHGAQIAHVDGEPFIVGPEITVRIVPRSLWVLR